MRRNVSLYPFAVSGVAVAALIASAAIVIAPAGAAPGKTTRKPPAAAAPKRPKLSGETIINDDLDMRFVLPNDWLPMPNSAQSVGKVKSSPIYCYKNSYDNIELKSRITYYFPPQFFLAFTDLAGDVEANEISQTQLDELVKRTIAESNKTLLNFRYEGGRHITVDGEAATAFACVATMQVTQEVMRLRVVSLFRNKRIYLFQFMAPVDDFPRYDAVFAKTLQNYHFLTPRKKNPTPPPVSPEDTPAKNPGTI